MAEAPWGQRIEDPIKYYRVTGFEYRDALSLDGLSPMGSCTPSTSQDSDTTLTPSGSPVDGEIGPLASEQTVGFLVAQGAVAVTAQYNGCESDDGTNWTACTDSGSGTVPTVLGVNPTLPRTGPATVTWHPLPPVVEYLPTPESECVVKGAVTVDPRTTVTTVPREVFTEPGEHTISLDLSSDVPSIEEGTVHSVAHYEITFVRVNADGSPYVR